MRRIALCLSLGHHYLQRCLQGLRETVETEGWRWIFHHLPPTPQGIERLQDWQPDGVIASVPDRLTGNLLEALPVPIVHLGNRHVAPRLPHVSPDHRAVGRQAAEHFLHLGLPFHACIGWPGQPFSDARGLGFQERLAEAGLPVLRHQGSPRARPGPQDRPPEEQGILEWLRQLPTPVGLFAANDYLAWQVAELIRQAGLRIPEHIALLGVDDDPLIGVLMHLPLSSVQVNPRRIGHEAAHLLHRHMIGDTSITEVLVPPAGVIPRTSTDLALWEDPLIREALQQIARAGARDLTVASLAHRVGVPRRTLERRFQQVLGRTVLTELHRVRVDQAKHLLRTTSATIADVAQRAGFRSASHFAALFKEATGVTPRAYRDEHHP